MSVVHCIRKFVLALIFASSSLALAQDKPTGREAERTQKVELLEKMAKAHQEAASCLKLGKSEEECREQMIQNCPMRGEAGNCPMMDGGMRAMMGPGFGPGPGRGLGRQGRGPKGPRSGQAAPSGAESNPDKAN